ncbi:hypothetical protein ZIOFF_046147 [Zingiber officinale]|uniref:Uncharacterized protein n=1 Tax=Zingiber officinale TaxID=94328 RepID=A0A8J5L299_ZINOF|nr:hypothetical protein ZIOFF_046147 [Zingiber officinale]
MQSGRPKHTKLFCQAEIPYQNQNNFKRIAERQRNTELLERNLGVAPIDDDAFFEKSKVCGRQRRHISYEPCAISRFPDKITEHDDDGGDGRSKSNELARIDDGWKGEGVGIEKGLLGSQANGWDNKHPSRSYFGYFCRSIPAGTENPSLSRLCYRGLWGSRNKRALILRWACYLDAFSSYPLCTWLPSVYRGHDNWYTRVANFLDHHISPHTWSYDFVEIDLVIVTPFVKRHLFSKSYEVILPSSLESCLAPLGILYLSASVGFGYRYPFVEGRSSFSWEYGMGYFRAVAPRTRTLARGISSTPSYPEKARSPCALTHPPWTNLEEEPLGFRGIGFSPMFALLKPTFSLPLRPHLLARVLRSKAERSPTDAFLHPTVSADRLGPFIFGARALDQ